jgi:hypothetical protein
MRILDGSLAEDPTGEAPHRSRLRTVPFIDREREAGELRLALEAALAGNGRVMLLGGEPGIGKTRLASAIADEAESRGVPVLWGRCWEDGSAPAYWPWNTALRRWIDQVGQDTVAKLTDGWGADLANIFPVLRERLPELPGSECSESNGARFRIFDITRRFLASLAKPAGLVVVLDDIHWADGPSLKLLEFIAGDMAEARILVVATYRDNEVQQEDPFSASLPRLVREPSTRCMLVSGLAPVHCARWAALAGLEGDAAALGEALHRETNGNPFFLGELVHLLADREDFGTELDAGRVPHSVREVILRRLARLGADCRATLAVAALFGDAIEPRMLADVLADPTADDHLELALRDRLLIQGGQPGQYGFAHDLIRRVLVGELPPSTRTAWHARIAAALERHATASEVVTELVHHLAAAGTSEALRKAFDYACRGAEQAARGLGWEEAVRLTEIALDVGKRCGALDARRALELRLALARALRSAGDIPAARARCEEVMAACRRAPNPAAFTHAALIFAGPVPEWGRIEPAARAALEEACRAGVSLDDALRARLYARLAGDLIATNDAEHERVFALCDAAATAARRAGADGALAVALLGTYTAAVMDLRPAELGSPMPDSEEALAAAEASGEHEYAAAIRYMRAMVFFAGGDPEAFSREVDDLATAAAASRVPEALWFADVLAALRATVQGRFAEGREAMERALATGRRAQLANAIGVYASQRMMWHALQGGLAEVAPELEAFVDVHPMGGGWRPFRALARLAAGDAVAARMEFQDLLASGLEPAQRGVMARSYLMGLSALCVALRDREHAAQLYDCVARRDDEWSIGGGQTLGPWELVLGGLARLCGRTTDAVRHFETAIRVARRMGSRPVVARAQSLLASVRLSMHTDSKERRRIAAMLEEAAHCARELGLIDVTARVERLRTKFAQAPTSPSVNAFRCEGDFWTVAFRGHAIKIKDGKGPRYLAGLLAASGQEVHVLELAGGAPLASTVKTSSTVAEGLTITGLRGGCEDGPDTRAAREYRARLEDLRAELDEAEELCDGGRAERIRAELDFYVTQLAQRFGTHARSCGPAETARKAVTKVLRIQIGKLLEAHPSLGEHFRDSVKMGTFCSYSPKEPVSWQVSHATSGRGSRCRPCEADELGTGPVDDAVTDELAAVA